MSKLTDTLDFDPSRPLDEQAAVVREFVSQLLTTAPDELTQQDCGGGLHRPTRRVWHLPGADLLQFFAYQYSPSDAACFALANLTTTLRPRLL